MAGELSKRIGEEGETLARALFKDLGWMIVAENLDVPCEFPAEHARKKAHRKAHGLDFLVAFNCPLIPSTRRNILISMKNSAIEKTKGRAATVKDDLRELDWLLKCYSRSSLKRETNADSDCSSVIDEGILIKINKDPDAAESFLRNLKDKEQISNTSGKDIHFIENARFDLIDLLMKFIKANRADYEIDYFYPTNPVNYAAETAKIEGKIVPVHHFASGPLTFRCVLERTKEMLLFSDCAFSPSTYERLIGLAYGCSQGWASRTTLVFPFLTPSDRDIAKSLSRGIASKDFSSSIELDSLDLRSRI